MEKLKTLIYEYPDSSENSSLVTSYDVFGVALLDSGSLTNDSNQSSVLSYR